MKKAATILAAVALVVLASGCEPKMTIAAKADQQHPKCGGWSSISGKVTPANATKTVVLQRTFGGTWRDFSSIPYDGAPEGVNKGTVDQATGAFKIPYGVPLGHYTLHFRVRSDGGVGTSPGFYVTITSDCLG